MKPESPGNTERLDHAENSFGDTMQCGSDQVRTAGERLATALALGNIGLWEWDPETGRTFYSDEWKKQLGLSSGEISEDLDAWVDRVHPDDRGRAIQFTTQVAAFPDRELEMILRMRHQNGTWRWIKARGKSVRSTYAEPVRAIGVQLDITQLKEMEIRLCELEKTSPTRRTMPQFKGCVLLAEDDDVSGPLAKLMLERLGIQVNLVTDGGQALEAAGAVRYDLILMDCWMPVAGGIVVTRRIRSSPGMACWKTPIVALTGNATSADAAECSDAGMNDFMSKPILFQNLIAMLEKFLPAPPALPQTSAGSGDA